jgi:lipopolysaccharide biosynthesis protein
MADTSKHSWLRKTLRPRTRLKSLLFRTPAVATPPRSDWPGDFFNWIDRSSGPRSRGFPDVWLDDPNLSIDEPSRVGVVVHAFYPELVGELLEQISIIPVDYDLLVTNATGTAIEIPAVMGRLRNVRVLEVPNHGRDILPLIDLVNAELLDPYHVILKVHTKRSPWRSAHSDLAGDGDRWRAELLAALLGDRENVETILSAFAERPSLGLVTADQSVLGRDMWGDNEDRAANVLRRIELELNRARLQFAAGSMYWIRGFALQGLRSLDLTAADFETEAGQVNATTAHALERVIGVLLAEAGLAIVGRSKLEAPSSTDSWRRLGPGPLNPRARIVPFYLPQFHPIPENDRWWGKGFTEWTNVTAARPMYAGHYQPRLPADLGFYDLRLDEVRRQQHELAASAGIDGFMYYYYWFAGHRLLETPIEMLLKSALPQPFCVMWANENWTRRWDGRESNVLIGQEYDRVPAEELIDDILPLLADDRYMTVGGKKVIAVYRPAQLPDLASTLAAWRRRARQAGVGELLLVHVDVGSDYHGVDAPTAVGFDCSLSFPPHNHLYQWLPHEGLEVDSAFGGNILSYAVLVKDAEKRLRRGVSADHHPGVMVAFDNTPRRQVEPDLWYGANPYTFRRWLATAVSAVLDRPLDERLVFVNAWNEWAEGAMLEPTSRYGRSYLLAVRDVALA